MNFLKNVEPPPEALNEQGQITDKKLLNAARYKFGVGNVMYQGEEAGLTALHTVIVRALGGDGLHIGITGGISTIGSLVQWLGVFLLKRYNSNRRAMNVALLLGVTAALLISMILCGAAYGFGAGAMIWFYLIVAYMLAAFSGIQWNIETNWIGDLVPQKIMGWFTGLKWVVAVFGSLCFMLLLGRLTDYRPTLGMFAFIYLVVALSHVVAIMLMSTVFDRKPQNANFFSGGSETREKINYRSKALWCYTAFYILWSGGRVPLNTFAIAYMLDQFGFTMTQVVLVSAIQAVISMVMLLILGKITDRFGCRIPLLIVSGSMALVMFLWVASAWWGFYAILAYQFISGLAGHAHSLLGINFGLEIFPAKGRAGYFGLSRLFIGAAVTIIAAASGFFVRGIVDWHYTVGSVTLNHYHLLFFICSSITLCCIIPLLALGKITPEKPDAQKMN